MICTLNTGRPVLGVHITVRYSLYPASALHKSPAYDISAQTQHSIDISTVYTLNYLYPYPRIRSSLFLVLLVGKPNFTLTRSFLFYKTDPQEHDKCSWGFFTLPCRLSPRSGPTHSSKMSRSVRFGCGSFGRRLHRSGRQFLPGCGWKRLCSRPLLWLVSA